MGDLDTLTDANIHIRLDASWQLTDRYRFLVMAGLSQLSAESATAVEHPRWINLSANAQVLFPTASGLRYFLQAGPGVYWSKSGSSDAGFNVGLGAQIPISAPFSLEFGADYHNVQTDEESEFITVQLGVLFR